MIPAKEVFYVDLPLSIATDEELLAIVAAITTNAPSSDVYKNNAALQSTVASVVSLAQDLTDAKALVSADQNKLETDKKVRDASRTALKQKLQLIRSLVQDAAPTAAEARKVGMKTRDKNASPAPLLAPTGGVLTPSKQVRGQWKAIADAVPGIDTYAMQISSEPLGPSSFGDVPGHGKTRIFKGYASNTRWWIRFAAVRGQAQSDWSPPVSILIP